MTDKFNKAYLLTYCLDNLKTNDYKLLNLEGFEFGDSGLGYYKHDYWGCFVVHVYTGLTMGNPLETYQAARGIIKEAAKLGDWNSTDPKVLAPLYDRFKEVYSRYAKV